MIKIRKATQNDIPAMADMWVALVLEENPSARPDVKRWCDMQRQLFGMSNYFVFVTEDNGKVVGVNNGLFLTDMETGEPYVDGGNFYVIPEYRNGVSGMKLHRNSLNVTRNLGAKFLRRKVSAKNKRMVDRFMAGKTHLLKEYIVDEMIGGTK